MSSRFEKDQRFWNEQFATLPEWTGLKPHQAYATDTRAARESLVIGNEIAGNDP